MGRYCIVCNQLFGCVQGSVKHICRDCNAEDHCIVPDPSFMFEMTGGICDHCWENRKALKEAIAD